MGFMSLNDEQENQQEQKSLALTEEQQVRRELAIREIRQFGDPVLRAKALVIEQFDAVLCERAQWMGELMRDAIGIGLAAPQVGISQRMLVYALELEGPVTTLINPEITWSSEELDVMEEGCLSLQGVQVEVERPTKIAVRAQNLDGEKIEFEAAELEARVIQHELDHLNGVLILDRTTQNQRRAALEVLRNG